MPSRSAKITRIEISLSWEGMQLKKNSTHDAGRISEHINFLNEVLAFIAWQFALEIVGTFLQNESPCKEQSDRELGMMMRQCWKKQLTKQNCSRLDAKIAFKTSSYAATPSIHSHSCQFSCEKCKFIVKERKEIVRQWDPILSMLHSSELLWQIAQHTLLCAVLCIVNKKKLVQCKNTNQERKFFQSWICFDQIWKDFKMTLLGPAVFVDSADIPH